MENKAQFFFCITILAKPQRKEKQYGYSSDTCCPCAVCDSYGQARKQPVITNAKSQNKDFKFGLSPAHALPRFCLRQIRGSACVGLIFNKNQDFLLKLKMQHIQQMLHIEHHFSKVYIYFIYIYFFL